MGTHPKCDRKLARTNQSSSSRVPLPVLRYVIPELRTTSATRTKSRAR
jgi:hypothetical protein